MVVSGGEAEADAAFKAAYDAIFVQQLESFRVPMPRISRKTGKQKWSMVEMWPLAVSSFYLSICKHAHALVACIVPSTKSHNAGY